MSIRSKLVQWFAAPELNAIQARYEAAFWTGNRSYLPAYMQSAREDIDTMSRQEILRRVRYFEKNSNTMQKALSILSVNVVGNGINPTPATKNPDWNKSALDWWNAWSRAADVTGTSSISELQDIVYRAQNIDGDHGIELTVNEFDRPALNLVEAHRITNGGLKIKEIEDAGYRLVDGVMVAPNGKPVAFTVSSDFDAKKVSVIPASRFVFFFTKKRAGQYRGISLFHSAILDLHDLDDLQKFEMLAAKKASAVSDYIKTAQGSVSPSDPMIGRSLQPTVGQAAPNREKYYAQAYGGETRVLQPGDEVFQGKNDRPSAATSGFWDRLENKFVQGSGLSYAALVDYRGNWGGATLRAAVTSDNRLFSLRTDEQARKWQRVWEYAIQWAMDHGELPQNPEFRNVRWHPPRRTTVDIGNESAATLNEIKAGTRTFETTYGEAGDDWRERLEQRAIEEKFIDDLAKKYGISRDLISSFAQERMSGILQENEPANTAKTKPDQKDESQ